MTNMRSKENVHALRPLLMKNINICLEKYFFGALTSFYARTESWAYNSVAVARTVPCCTALLYQQKKIPKPLSHVFEPTLLRVLVYCEDGLDWMICDILALCSSLHEPMLVST